MGAVRRFWRRMCNLQISERWPVELLGALALLLIMAMNTAHFVRISSRHELDAHDPSEYDR